MGNEAREVLQIVKNRIHFFENLNKNPLEQIPNGQQTPCFNLPALGFLNFNGQPLSVEKDVECFLFNESPTSREDSWQKLKKTKAKCSDNQLFLLSDSQCTKMFKNQEELLIATAIRKKQSKYFERITRAQPPKLASEACFDFLLECLIPSATDYHNQLVQSPRSIIEVLEKIRLP